jgi:hypothetical protein
MVVSVIVLITRFQKQTALKEAEEPMVAVA